MTFESSTAFKIAVDNYVVFSILFTVLNYKPILQAQYLSPTILVLRRAVALRPRQNEMTCIWVLPEYLYSSHKYIPIRMIYLKCFFFCNKSRGR